MQELIPVIIRIPLRLLCNLSLHNIVIMYHNEKQFIIYLRVVLLRTLHSSDEP